MDLQAGLQPTSRVYLLRSGLSLGLWGLKFKIDGYNYTLSDKSFATSRHDKNENK